MKKFIFILIFLVGFSLMVSGQFAEINKDQFVFKDSAAADKVNSTLCQEVDCGANAIDPKIIASFFESNSPISKTLDKNNDVRTIVSSGGNLVSPLEIGTAGEVVSGEVLIGNEMSSIGTFVGDGLNKSSISASGVIFSKSKGISTFTFNSSDAELNILGNKFSNIEPGKSSFIKVNEQGKILEASFSTNAVGGVYKIEGAEFPVPGNSQVFYKDGILKVVTKDNSKLASFPKFYNATFPVMYEGKGLVFPNNFTVSGKLNYGQGGFFMNKNDFANINGIDLNATDFFRIYSDDSNHEGNYISLGKNFRIAADTNPGFAKAVFKKGNPYFKDISKDSYVSLGLIDKNSEIKVMENSVKKIPDVFCTKGFDIESGQISLYSKAGKIFYNELSQNSLSSSQMDIHTQTGKYKKLISLGSASSLICQVGENEDSLVAGANLFRKDLSKFPNLAKNSYDTFSKTYEEYSFYSSYLDEAQDILNKAMQKKYPNLDLSAFNVKDNKQLNEVVKSASDTYYLTPAERVVALKGTQYENYDSIVESYRDIGITLSTYGVIEGEISAKKENYGLRQALYIYKGK